MFYKSTFLLCNTGGCVELSENSKSHLRQPEVKVNHMEIGSGPNSPSNSSF